MELKAVLHSLESFTQQAKAKNFHAGSASPPNNLSSNINEGNAANRNDSAATKQNFPISVANKTSCLTKYSVSPLLQSTDSYASNCPAPAVLVEDTPDLVQNLPRNRATPPNSDCGNSPDNSVISDNEACAIPLSDVFRQQEVLPTVAQYGQSFDEKVSLPAEMKYAAVAEPESSSIAGSIGDLTQSFADCFAEEKEGTLRKLYSAGGNVSSGISSYSKTSESGTANASEMFAAANATAFNDSEIIKRERPVSCAVVGRTSSPSNNNEENTVGVRVTARQRWSPPLSGRLKPPIPKKPMKPISKADSSPADSPIKPTSWSKEPVEILKM